MLCSSSPFPPCGSWIAVVIRPCLLPIMTPWSMVPNMFYPILCSEKSNLNPFGVNDYREGDTLSVTDKTKKNASAEKNILTPILLENVVRLRRMTIVRSKKVLRVLTTPWRVWNWVVTFVPSWQHTTKYTRDWWLFGIGLVNQNEFHYTMKLNQSCEKIRTTRLLPLSIQFGRYSDESWPGTTR